MKNSGLNSGGYKKGGGDLIVFVISLLVAMAVWCVLKLSGNYQSVYHFKVEARTSLAGRTFKSTSEGSMAVKGSASGFYAMRHKFFNKTNLLKFHISPTFFKPLEGREDAFYLLTSVLRDKVSDYLSGTVSIEEIPQDTLVFIFPKISSKKVPVALTKKFSFAQQYMAMGRTVILPDSIEIHGREELLKGVDSVVTEEVIKNGLKNDVHGAVNLVEIPGITFQTNEVIYQQKVGRYFEKSMTVPLHAENVPQDERMVLVPSEVTVTYRQDYLDKREYTAADIILAVDYTQAQGATSSKGKVLIKDAPAAIYNIRIEPQFVDRVILTTKENNGN